MNGWIPRKLGEVLALEYGKPLPKERRNPTGRVPAFGANGVKCMTDDVYIDQPSIIVGRKGSAGAVTLTTGPAWPLDVTYFVRHDESQYDLRFLFYLLKSLDLPSMARGVKPGLNRNDVYAIERLIPGKPDQERIATILDGAFAAIATAIANAEKNIDNAHELFSHQRDALLAPRRDGWLSGTLGDWCDGFEYGSSAKSKPVGAVPVLRMGNLQRGEIDWADLVYTSDKSEIDRYLLNDRDVLFNRTNSVAHVGKSAIYRGDRPAAFAGYLIRVRYRPGALDPEFLNYYLNGSLARSHGAAVMSKSINQANISASKLKAYPISIPDVGEQRAIAAQIGRIQERTDAVLAVQHGKLSALEDLCGALLGNALSGDIGGFATRESLVETGTTA